MTRSIHLTGFLKPAGEYFAGWRHPDAPAAAGVDFATVSDLVQRLEAAAFDAVFIPDLVGVPDARPEVLERVAVVNEGFEPITLLGALSAVTERIGLLATASTSYSEPYTVARQFASLDHLSHGRAGWNVVTSLNDSEGRNFGHAAHLAHADRYRRAEEFVDTVFGLWDSFDDDAFTWDVAEGRAFREDALHALDHRGESFSVAGPLNIARPVQGHPVIAQAGSSGPGRALAARVADLVFTRALPLDETLAFTTAIKAQAEGFGRAPGDVLVLPELAAIVAPTRAEAEDRFARVRDLLHPTVALADVEYWTGTRLAHLPLDAPLPPLADTNASAGAQAEIYRQAQRDGLTIGDLARIVAHGDGAVVGSPTDIADYIEEYVTAGAADGFTVSFPWLPETLVGFTDLVIPELRRRGLFRTGYEGTTLRDHLGLARPGIRQRA